MIILRKSDERRHERHRKREAWLTFDADAPARSLALGFETLELFREGRIPPRAGTRRPLEDAEIITYVRLGSLVYEDSMGHTGVIRSGEFQRMTAGRRIRYGEMNASMTNWAHVFQIRLRSPGPALEPGHEQKRFSVGERRGVLRAVASPDARDGSLRVHQDAFLYSAILGRGRHLVYALPAERSAWLHVVEGKLDLGDACLVTGDGAGFTSERAVSITARDETEILLLDLGGGHAHAASEAVA